MYTGDFFSTKSKKKIAAGSMCKAFEECLDRENLTFYKSDLEYYNDECVSLYDVISHLNKRIKNRRGDESGSSQSYCSNSKLTTYIDLYQVLVYGRREFEFSDNDSFLLEYNAKSRSYDIKNADEKLTELIRDNEEEIFKNIFVPILSCPEWMQYDLDHIKNIKIAQNNAKTLVKQVCSFFRK